MQSDKRANLFSCDQYHRKTHPKLLCSSGSCQFLGFVASPIKRFYINSVFKGEEIVWLRCHSAVLLDPQSSHVYDNLHVSTFSHCDLNICVLVGFVPHHETSFAGSLLCSSSWGLFLSWKGFFLWGSFSFLELRVQGQRVLCTAQIIKKPPRHCDLSFVTLKIKLTWLELTTQQQNELIIGIE